MMGVAALDPSTSYILRLPEIGAAEIGAAAAMMGVAALDPSYVFGPTETDWAVRSCVSEPQSP